MGNRIKAATENREVSCRDTEEESRKSELLFNTFFILCLFYLLSLVTCFLPSASYADEKADKNAQPVPTIITSEALTADNKAKTALFTGSVVAKKGNMTLYADRMLVYYIESGGGSNIDKIDAEGNVKLIRGDRIVTSGKAVYFAGAEERAIFTESPRAAEGKNVVTGTKMTYYMKDDRSVVENSKVFIVEKEQGSHDRKATDKNQDKKKK
jgi:lipopolysaccharide export system protein LptA